MALPSVTPNVLGDDSLSTFDAIVIGSGAGGSTVARTLAKAGQKVLILEQGSNYYPSLDDPNGLLAPLFSNDELKLEVRNLIAQDPVIEPRTFRATPGGDLFVGDVNGLPRNVGGAAVHADMKFPRFRKTDFQLGTLLGDVAGASFADWPVGYDQLERFYVEIEQAIGVQGPEGAAADPFAEAKSKPYPMPPGLPMYANSILATAARSLGYHPFAYPTAVTSRPYRGRPACIDCGFCSGYGCPINAKSSPAVTLLREALLTGNVQLRFNAAVTRLVPNGTGTAVDHVEYLDATGALQTASADRYVLAASAMESARLMLLSGSGFGNSSGMVGRNLMFHYQTIVIGVLNNRVHGERGRSVTMGMSDFRGTPGDANAPLAGIIELATTSDLIGEAKEYAQSLNKLGAPLAAIMRESPLRAKLVAMTMQAEDAPQPTNQVDLDPAVRDVYGRPSARVTYANHVFETSAREFYLPKMLQIHEMAGAQFGLVDPPDQPSQSRHIMGTMRMGSDPASSVCNAVGQLHDVGNLWCADAGLFPTSSGFNPTLTLQTLALWVAANIVAPGDPESILVES